MIESYPLALSAPRPWSLLRHFKINLSTVAKEAGEEGERNANANAKI